MERIVHHSLCPNAPQPELTLSEQLVGEVTPVGFAFASRSRLPGWTEVHATMLDLLGIDHERLTCFHNGRSYRLTDVAGEVIHEILA